MPGSGVPFLSVVGISGISIGCAGGNCMRLLFYLCEIGNQKDPMRSRRGSFLCKLCPDVVSGMDRPHGICDPLPAYLAFS